MNLYCLRSTVDDVDRSAGNCISRLDSRSKTGLGQARRQRQENIRNEIFHKSDRVRSRAELLSQSVQTDPAI